MDQLTAHVELKDEEHPNLQVEQTTDVCVKLQISRLIIQTQNLTVRRQQSHQPFVCPGIRKAESLSQLGCGELTLHSLVVLTSENNSRCVCVCDKLTTADRRSCRSPRPHTNFHRSIPAHLAEADEAQFRWWLQEASTRWLGEAPPPNWRLFLQLLILRQPSAKLPHAEAILRLISFLFSTYDDTPPPHPPPLPR